MMRNGLSRGPLEIFSSGGVELPAKRLPGGQKWGYQCQNGLYSFWE